MICNIAPKLTTYEKIYSYIDLDKQGSETYDLLFEYCTSEKIDCENFAKKLFTGYEDFNDFICDLQITM
jgi:hypothetical protein